MTTNLCTLPSCWRPDELDTFKQWDEWGAGVIALWSRQPTMISMVDGGLNTLIWRRTVQLIKKDEDSSALIEYELAWILPESASCDALDVICAAHTRTVATDEAIRKLTVLGHDANQLVAVKFGIVDATQSVLRSLGFELVDSVVR